MTQNDDHRYDHLRPIAGGRAGGNGGSHSGPNFDWRKYWQDAARKGGSGGGDRSGPSMPDLPPPSAIFAGIAAVIVAIALYTSIFTVDVSEQGVVTRFGAYHRTAEPGLNFKLPFGMERTYLVQSRRILQEEFGFRTRSTQGQRTTYDKDAFRHESLMLSGDLNVADVEWIIQYRISDPWKYLFHASDVTRTIRDISLSIMRRVVGDRLVGDVLTTARVEIADQARELTQEVLDSYDIGIAVERVVLQGVNPPEKVKPAFNEVNRAKQVQEQTINNAEREYNRVIPEARGQAEKLVAEAEAYAINVVNRAKGDAQRFTEVLSAYRAAPELVKRRQYIETLEEVFSRMERLTIVDRNAKGLLPLYGQPHTPTPSAAGAAKQTSSIGQQTEREVRR